MSKPVLQIIINSNKSKGNGPALAYWLMQHTEADGRFDVELVNIAELNLPYFDEPRPPSIGPYIKDHTKNWSKIATRADGYIFIVPEHDVTAPLSFINAITYLHNEWAYKSIGFLSYGGVSGTTRAVDTIRQMLSGLKTYPILDIVALPNYFDDLDEDGNFLETLPLKRNINRILDEIHKVEHGLKVIRTHTKSKNSFV